MLKWLLVLGAGAFALAAPQFLSLHWTNMIIHVLIFGLFALSSDLLIGHTGLLPLGHAGFFAVAAYTTAILQMRYDQHFLVAALAGIVAAGLLALMFSIAIRTSDVYFTLLTLALGTVVWGVAFRWVSFTGGDNGIVGMELPVVAGIDLSVLSNYYYVVLVVVVACVVGYAVLVRSPFGLSLRGIRESDSRMRTLGYQVVSHKLVAWVLSALLSGVAGVLYVYWNKFVSPATAVFSRSSEAVLMVIIGGSGSIVGPFLGSALISWIRFELGASMSRYMSIMGLIFVLTALYAPDGLTGLWRRLVTNAGGLWQRAGSKADPEVGS